MKNVFTKYINQIKKAKRVTIQRSGDYIFIADGYTAIKIPKAVYDVYFRPVSGYFVDIEDGYFANVVNSGVPVVSESGLDIKKFFSDSSRDVLLEESCILLYSESKRNKKNILVRPFLDDNLTVFIDDFYLSNVREITHGVYRTGKNPYSPIIWDSESNNFSVLLMPRRPEPHWSSDLRKLNISICA